MSKIEVICYNDKNFHFGQKYKVTREEKILMAIQEVIKYEGENSVLIYKHPAEDFNTMSQLIVHESQEAVFFSDGQALDSFRAGRYTLETKNIPLISKLRNLVSGGVSPFHTEVKSCNDDGHTVGHTEPGNCERPELRIQLQCGCKWFVRT